MRQARTIGILFICIAFFSAFVSGEGSNYGVKISKSISQNTEKNIYDFSIKIENGDKLESLAKYKIVLPKGVTFKKMTKIDAFMNHKVKLNPDTKRKELNVIWMHIRKNTPYQLSFQVETSKKVKKLKFKSFFHGLSSGAKVKFEDTSKFTYLLDEDAKK